MILKKKKKNRRARGFEDLQCCLTEKAELLSRLFVWTSGISTAVRLLWLLPTWSADDCWVNADGSSVRWHKIKTAYRYFSFILIKKTKKTITQFAATTLDFAFWRGTLLCSANSATQWQLVTELLNSVTTQLVTELLFVEWRQKETSRRSLHNGCAFSW